MRPPTELRRLGVVTLATATTLTAVVLVVRSLLPQLAGWVFPAALGAATVVLVVAGRRLAAAARVPGARAVAGWAGVTSSLAILALSTLTGVGGGLVVVLVAVLVANAGLALWFGSSVHFAATQWLGFVWAVVAHVYGVVPLAGLVLAVAGLWYTGAVRFSRAVVVSTTLLVPLTAALAVHPLTHDGVAIDGADIATVAGFTALAVLFGARVTDGSIWPGLWPTMRATATVATVAQIGLGGVPAVSGLLAPTKPWPGILLGLAALCAAVVTALLSEVRAGTLRAVEYTALLWAAVAATVLFGALAGSIVAAGALGVPLVVDLGLGRVGERGVLPRLAGVVGVTVGILLVAAPPLAVTAGVLVAVAALVFVVGLRALASPPSAEGVSTDGGLA